MPSDDDIALVDRRRLRWEPTDPNTLLGEGSFGIVYRGRFNGTPVAIKVIKRPPPAENASDDDRFREHAALKQHRREIHRLKVVRNPYIIQYLGVFRGEHPRDLYIVTEYLEGASLHDSLSKMRARKAALDDGSFLQIATHIARGLNHVHVSNYTHGDMKPQNILLTSAFQFSETDDGNMVASIPASAKVKIADFGLSKRLDGAESASVFGSTTATTDFGTGPCGTYLYMSPEAYDGISRLTDSQAKAADVYAFALVLFELLSGLQSWGYERVRNPMQLSAFVRSGKRPAWGPRESQIDPAYIDLVKRCWSQSSDERPTVEEIVDFLEEQQDMYDRRKSEMVKCPSSQAFSDVTKHDGFSPGSLNQQGAHDMPHHVAEPGSSGNIGGLEGGEDARSQGSTPSSELCEGEECKRIDTKVDSEDDAHTLEEGEDAFGSQDGVHFELPPIKDNADNLEEGENGFGSQDGVDFEPPPIKEVLSMRLTPNEVEHFLPKVPQKVHVEPEEEDSVDSASSTDSEGFEDTDDDEGDYEGAISNAVSNWADMNGKGGLDSQENDESRFVDSIVPGPVRPVESFTVELPEYQELDLPENERPVLGLGSVVERSDSRSNSMIMKSFLGVSLADMKSKGAPEDEKNTPIGEGNQNASGDPTSLFEPVKKSLHMGPAPPLPPAPTELESDENSKENNTTGAVSPRTPEETADAVKPAGQQERTKTYTSPTVEECEVDSFFPGTEIPMQSTNSRSSNGWPLPRVPDRPQNNSYANGYSHQPNPHSSLSIQGASAPPLSDTSNSALGGGAVAGQVPPHQVPSMVASPAFASPGSNYNAVEPNLRIPPANLNPNMLISSHSVDNVAVVAALQRHDASVVLRDWWNRGYMRAVASGLAQAHDIGGEELLDLARDLTARNNQNVQERRDAIVARDLCAAIGHIARNSSMPLGQLAITRTVREVLLVLHTFNYIGVVRTDVFSFANFALCNLFKVYNVIQDFQLRSMTASWITYLLSWNVSQGKGGPFDQVLAYTATSAARNFMWMNEDNVRAFVGCISGKGYGAPSASMTLISSMMYFDWKGNLSVVEASLSAMAMIVHFPRQRCGFLKAHGADAVLDVLCKHAGNSGITSLSLWMVTVLFSGPANSHSHEEAETMRRVFIDRQGCQKFVKALERVDQMSGSEKQRVENLEKGYNALLTAARFGGSLRAHLIEAGCMPMILNSVRQLGSSLTGHYGSEEEIAVRKRLGVVLCELIREISNEHKGKSYMQDNNVRHPLENMMRIHGSDDGFTSCCRVALTKLAY